MSSWTILGFWMKQSRAHMFAFSLLIIIHIYDDLDWPYGSLSCDPHGQWNHAGKLLFSFKTQNTFKNDFGMTRHLGGLAVASYPGKKWWGRGMIYKDWHKASKHLSTHTYTCQTLFASVLIPRQLPKEKKGRIILHLFSEHSEPVLYGCYKKRYIW